MKTIELGNNRGTVLVDDEDYDMLSEHSWQYGKGYAQCAVKRPNGRWGTTFMHRIIMGAVTGQEIDHANHNKLDNQKNR